MLKQDHTTVFMRFADKTQNYMPQLTANINDTYRNKNGNWLLEKIIFRTEKEFDYNANTYGKEDFESHFRNDNHPLIKKADDAGNVWDIVA
jgi:hypothetical protein